MDLTPAALKLQYHVSPLYLWGRDLPEFFALSQQGQMLAGTMHADELDEAYDQAVRSNDVPEAQFRAINLFVFADMEGAASSARRFIRKVFYSDGAAKHVAVYTRDKGLSTRRPRVATWEALCRTFLEEVAGSRRRTAEEMRRAFLVLEERHNRSL